MNEGGMMTELTWATPLYEFLRQCNASPLEKRVLDCGAGGDDPPLALFYRYGYRTCGVEIAGPALQDAAQFCHKQHMPLNIFRGDMRHLPFADESFSFVYSYNAIFFMTKPDIALSVREMERTLRPGGLLYVNFYSVDDPDDGVFCPTAFARSLLQSEQFAKHADDEADAYLTRFEIQRKEKRILGKLSRTRWLKSVTIEYIARKREEP
jgi:SAM-dependent methyltransferase